MAAHETLKAHAELKGSSDRSFGFVFTIVFLLVALAPLRHDEPVRQWALALAGIFAVVSSVKPSLLNSLNRAWMKFGLILSLITTPIIMAVMFF